jgi:TolB protein
MHLRAKLGTALALSVLVAGGCATLAGATRGTTDPSASARPAASIPWSEVGPGWLLGVWNKDKPLAPGERPPPGYVQHPPQDLYLVSPSGARYLAVRQPNNLQAVQAWSGDGRRALETNPGMTVFRQVDLASGATVSSFRFPASNSVFVETVGYTNPDGLALLVTTQRGRAQVLQRFTPTGGLLGTYPRSFAGLGAFDGHYAESPNGTTIALGAPAGVALVTNGGTVVTTFRVPRSTYCIPTRWWTPTVILASCSTNGLGRLYELHVVTGAVDDLTATPRPPDLSDENAWSVSKRVFVQDAGGCGYQYLARLGSNHRTTPVSVPHVNRADSVLVLGATSTSLALQATIACGDGESALWWNPVTNASTVVLGPTAHGRRGHRGVPLQPRVGRRARRRHHLAVEPSARWPPAWRGAASG